MTSRSLWTTLFMDFDFSDDQEQLRRSLRSFLRDRYSFEQRRAALRSEDGYRPGIWAAFADLGLTGMPLPERVGGLACDAVNTHVVMEELGRALAVEPYLETVVVCGGLLARVGGPRADRMLTAIARGEAMVAFASAEPMTRYDPTAISMTACRTGSGWCLDGVKSVVVAAPWASHLLVTARTSGLPGERDGLSLFLIDKIASGVTLVAYPTIDGRRAADVIFRNVAAPTDALIGASGVAIDEIERTMDEAIAAVCAEAVGVLEQMHEDTVAYAKQRRQFGQPLARFQILQHRMVDMHLEIELARSAAYLAMLKLTATPRERTLAASAAKATIGKACRFVGQNAVQLHGGVGMTDDIAVSHLFRRASMIELELGTVDFHLSRHAALCAPRA